MARGIQIPFTLNPREFLRGLRTIGDGLDDVQDDFRDLERSGDRAADDITRTWDRAGDRIEDSFKGVADRAEAEFDQVERDARRAGSRAGTSMNDGMTGSIRRGSFRGAAGALAAEAGQEVVESWGEAIREGNPAGVFREVFSNAALIGAAAGGPIGAAAGFAVSAFMVPLLDRLSQEKANVSAAVESLFSDVSTDSELTGAEAGRAFARGFIDEASIPGQVQEALGLESALDSAREVNRIAQLTGLSYADVQLAILGNRDALDRVAAKLGENEALYDRNRDAAGKVKDVDANRLAELNKQKDRLNEQKGALDKISGVGGQIRDKNRETAALVAQQRNAQNEIRIATSGTKDHLNSMRVPNVGPMRDGLASAAASAERAERAINRIPSQKTVTITTELGGAYRGKRLPI